MSIPEKGQLDAYGITAFGIPITSRHAIANEMAEMLMFCRAVASLDLEKHIESVFYDSNAYICNFEFNQPFDIDGEDAQKIRECATQTLGQFEWKGHVEHGLAFLALSF